MDNDTIRLAVLEATEASLAAQLKAIRSLRIAKQSPGAQSLLPAPPSRSKGRSHIDMTYDILVDAANPLHVSEIILRIAARFNVRVDRESLVSALSKRVARADRFKRTDKNTFALIEINNQKAPQAPRS
jgi:hypothetical protein